MSETEKRSLSSLLNTLKPQPKTNVDLRTLLIAQVIERKKHLTGDAECRQKLAGYMDMLAKASDKSLLAIRDKAQSLKSIGHEKLDVRSTQAAKQYLGAKTEEERREARKNIFSYHDSEQKKRQENISRSERKIQADNTNYASSMRANTQISTFTSDYSQRKPVALKLIEDDYAKNKTALTNELRDKIATGYRAATDPFMKNAIGQRSDVFEQLNKNGNDYLIRAYYADKIAGNGSKNISIAYAGLSNGEPVSREKIWDSVIASKREQALRASVEHRENKAEIKTETKTNISKSQINAGSEKTQGEKRVQLESSIREKNKKIHEGEKKGISI